MAERSLPLGRLGEMEVCTMKTRKSLRMFLLVAVVVAAVPMTWPGQVQAQGASQGSPQMAAGAQQVQGKITTLDPSRKMLTLEDGTRLTIPPTVQLPGGIKEGSIVKASFEERSGENVVTSLEVQAP